MTPDEFLKALETIYAESKEEPDVCHVRMDDLIIELLKSLGYSAGAEFFDLTYKWYD